MFFPISMMKAGLQGTIWLALICLSRYPSRPRAPLSLSADIKKPAPLLLLGQWAVPGLRSQGCGPSKVNRLCKSI